MKKKTQKSTPKIRQPNIGDMVLYQTWKKVNGEQIESSKQWPAIVIEVTGSDYMITIDYGFLGHHGAKTKTNPVTKSVRLCVLTESGTSIVNSVNYSKDGAPGCYSWLPSETK